MVMIDSNGELIEQSTMQSLTLRNPETAHESDRNKHYEERTVVQQTMLKHHPNIVVVGTNSLHSIYLRRNLNRDIFKVITTEGFQEELVRFEVDRNELLDQLPYVVFGDVEVPRIFSNSQRAKRMYPEYTQQLLQAVSLARFYQDPLAETLGLWSDPNENNILSLKLHDLQNEVNK